MEHSVKNEDVQARPFPCPECQSTRGYSRVGPFRVHCLNCNSLLKNSEVNLDNEVSQ